MFEEIDFCFDKLLRIVQKYSEIPVITEKKLQKNNGTNTSESVRKVINSG